MARKKKDAKTTESLPRPNDHWVITEEITVNGRKVVRGTELSIVGERGRYKFLKHVYNPKTDSAWIDVVGGSNTAASQHRSFRQDRIKTVHWKNKARPIRQPKEDSVE
jgi:hypothetical protein